MEKRASSANTRFKKSQLSKHEIAGSSHIFDSWSLIQLDRDSHPESRDAKPKAANQIIELKFG